MSNGENYQIISQLQGEIASAENRKAVAEKNICQLTALNASCNDYQIEFDSARIKRRMKMNDFMKISGQARLIEAYGSVLGDLLNRTAYISAYGSIDTAKSEISQEIERQKQIIDECNNQIASLSSRISYLS